MYLDMYIGVKICYLRLELNKVIILFKFLICRYDYMYMEVFFFIIIKLGFNC